MRLIFGFIFFGMLFYTIWYFFPDAFQILVTWAGKLFDLIRNGIEKIISFFTSQTQNSRNDETDAFLGWLSS